MNNRFTGEILKGLERMYPQAVTALKFQTPFQLLVAVILSAQCTDERVNKVTETLFRQFPTAADFANLNPQQLEPWVKSCGLFRNKSKNIVAAAKKLVAEYDGRVPGTMAELLLLPGVGRKTANVMLSNVFNEPAIAVDTHVFRVANRLGLVANSTVLGTEKELCRVIPRDDWGRAHHWLIYHGRNTCKARKPL
ncbi:endonuclease III [Metallumcola ferriviriculae]|uniref:Endonuclease III n=1 Tax=Metallumcola ferriviriculae TaxID=3039180 RepID=A0AAU0UST1_9FIRM|nr:endonuclease III [Desulfitibacteraceae bacterium MK1]